MVVSFMSGIREYIPDADQHYQLDHGCLIAGHRRISVGGMLSACYVASGAVIKRYMHNFLRIHCLDY